MVEELYTIIGIIIVITMVEEICTIISIIIIITRVKQNSPPSQGPREQAKREREELDPFLPRSTDMLLVRVSEAGEFLRVAFRALPCV